ncbi:hypothetical protein ACEQ8H_006012 [Pleosporales sp. CAS-2024a]
MRSSLIYTTALLASTISAAPAGRRQNGNVFPLSNGFPNPSAAQTTQIQIQAHGTLPNGPPPPSLSAEGITNLKLIALNELFEVAFFTELMSNLTAKIQGYDLGYGHEYVLDSLTAIVAQEELHLLNANGALKHFNAAPIEPCKYSFPVTDFQSAIALAGTFTDLVLGTLQDVNQIFAQNGDAGLVRAVSSVIGNEAEQEGFYRLVQRKRPSSQPFLTTATRDFAFTAIQSFVLPGSCPNIHTIPLKTFKGLTVETQPMHRDATTVQLSISKTDAGMYEPHNLNVVFINGQNVPLVKSVDNWSVGNDKVVFEADFPSADWLMTGLTIAAVTMGKDTFASADDVAAATIFGPGLIEMD